MTSLQGSFGGNMFGAESTLVAGGEPLVDQPEIKSVGHNYGTSPCLMGKSTISMAIFHGFPWLFVCLPEGT